MRVVQASEMQEMDRLAIQDLGIPGVVLMENAARDASRVFLEHFQPSNDARVLILCGSGNNGGDGYVMARYLHQAGLCIKVVILSPDEKITGDALVNLEIIRKMDLDIIHVSHQDEWDSLRSALYDFDYIIDGILGTGLHSDVRGLYARIIDDVNASQKPIMAIDIPSGLNADNGQIMGTAVRAELTVTFGFPKIGQVIFPGVERVGRLIRVDIGIPNAVSDRIKSVYSLIEPGDFTHLFHLEKMDMHKGDKGHLLILAGSPGKTGAAALSALGALRAGAGLVTVGIPKSLNPILEVKLTEGMTAPLPETSDGSLALEAEKDIEQLIPGKTAMAIGPGLSTHPETCALVKRIISRYDLPLVIDADGLNALVGGLEVLSTHKEKIILTPHPGEIGRLVGRKNVDIQADRMGTVSAFIRDHGCYLVLKGARTLIGEPNGTIHINPTGNPALSSAGSGDVLTGVIAGFMARQWPLCKAVVAGIYLHGLAADLLAEEKGHAGVLASELLNVFPNLMASLERGEWPLNDSAPFHSDRFQSL
jgi:NAD(P)H-hydrate epimerase